MANKLGSLLVQLAADTALLQRDMGKAVGIVNSASQKMSVAAVSARRALGAIGIGVTFTALIRGMGNVIDKIDEMSKAAQKFGVPIQKLSSLSHAAELADVSITQLGAGLARLSKNAADTFSGSGAATKFFDALGVSVADTSGKLRPVGDLLADVAQRISMMRDGTVKTAVAIGLFGKAGAQLIPLLNEGRGGLAEAADEAQRLGIVIDQETGKAAEEFNDNLKRLGVALSGVGIGLSKEVLPPLVGVTETLSEFVQKSGAVRTAIDAISFSFRHMGDAAEVALGGFAGGILAGPPGAVIGAGAVLTKKAFDAANSPSVGPTISGVIQRTPVAGPDITDSVAARLGSDAARKAATSEAKKQAEAIAGVIARLKEEEFAVGKSDAAMVAYNLTLLKAPAALIAEAQAIAEKTQAHKNDLEIIEKERAAREDLIKLVKDEQATVIRGLMTQDAAIRTAAALKVERVLMAAEESVEIERNAAAMIANIHKEADKQIADLNDERAKAMKEAAADLGQAFTHAFDDAVVAGAKFSDVLKGLLEDIQRIALRVLVTKPLESALSTALGGLFGGSGGGNAAASSFLSGNAKGNAFSGGDVIPFARGGIVSRPTLFPMAKGAGLMGEAGPEAIMPLRRMPGGDLGVSGSGTVVQIIDQRGTQSAPVDVQRQMVAGREQIRVLIRDQVEAAISSGGLDRAMASKFGIRSSGAR